MQAIRVVFILLICVVGSIYAQYWEGRVMEFLGRWSSGIYDAGGAETVAYDSSTQRLFVTSAQGARLIALNIRDPRNPTLVFDSSLSRYGSVINSVACSHGIVAVAIEDSNRQEPGVVVLLDADGALLARYIVGSVPDMLTFTPDGRYLLVANEGEPNDSYTIDPEGSVSIIDISGGVDRGSVRTVSFEAFNSKRDSLLLAGIKIGAPNNPTVAQDLEPEYIAVAPNGKTAYVTLQENNAIAEIDIPTATVVQLLPLGGVDYRYGDPELTMIPFPLSERPILGITDKGQEIFMGGLSGLYYLQTDSQGWWHFLTVTDRGPNAEPTRFGSIVGRPFVLPNFQPRVVRFAVHPQSRQVRLVSQTLLYRSDGITPLSGRPNMQAASQGLAHTDEIPIDLYGTVLPNDPLGADLEGIAVDHFGRWWMCDEYRPSLYCFDTTGRLLARYVPIGTAAAVGAPPGTFGTEVLPSVYSTRRANRGFEAIAIEGNKVYAFIQSPLDNPNTTRNTTSSRSTVMRVLEFDMSLQQVTGEYLLPLLHRYDSTVVDKIGDAVSLGNKRFMVVIRDSRVGRSSKKLVYEVNLGVAANLVTNPPSLGSGETLELLGIQALRQRGIRFASLRQVTNLAALGYEEEKVEGLARVNDSTFVVVNDNDFGVVAETIRGDGTVSLVPQGGTITVGVLTLTRSHRIDPSDRDGGIVLRKAPAPIIGLHQPDGIAAFITSDNELALVTANEGDAREWGNFEEDRRLRSMSSLLDPMAFPSTASLRDESQWGRLRVLWTSGDLDGDGDYDEVHVSGTRSFTIWRADGSLLYSSGDDFDRLTAQLYPSYYNCSHTSNTRDARSPSRGVEPEGVATLTIGDSVYAFICFERIGGIAMYNVTNPKQVRFVDYINTRDFSQSPGPGQGGDLGPEVVYTIPAAKSPNGKHLIVTANEVSGTVSIYGIDPVVLRRGLPSTYYACEGVPMRLTIAASGPSLEYRWYKEGVRLSEDSSTLDVPSAQQKDAGIYECWIVPTAGLGNPMYAGRCTVAVLPPPRILRQPSSMRVFPGQVAIFQVETSFDNPTVEYEWLKNGRALEPSARYRGGTTSQLIITSVQAHDTGTYVCRIRSTCGEFQTESVKLQLTQCNVAIAPSTQQVLCIGRPLRLLCATGNMPQPYRVRWYKGAQLVSEDTVTEFESAEYTKISIVPEDAGIYSCHVLSLGSDVPLCQSQSVEVVVVPESEVNLRVEAPLCEGKQGRLRVQLSSPEYASINWFSEGSLLSTDPVLNIIRLGTYYVHVETPCGAIRDSIAITTVLPPRIVRDLPSAISQPLGTEVTLTLEAQGAEHYQWFFNGVPIVGAQNAVLRFVLSAEKEGSYTCYATNVCGGVVSNRVRVRAAVSSVESSIECDRSAVEIMPMPLKCGSSLTLTVVHLPCFGLFPMQLQLYDGVGRLVYSKELGSQAEHATSYTLSIPNCSAGIYTIMVHGGGKVWRSCVVAY